MGGISHIVPVVAANHGDPTVVVEVIPNGSRPLDVRLLGCEGENVYQANIHHDKIAHLKKSTSKGSDDGWETILSYFLLQHQPKVDQAGILEGIRMVYSINGNELEISIRRDVSGIKVTLGDISLRYVEEEINPFEWAQKSALAHSSALAELSSLTIELKKRQDAADQLTAQLEDFIKAKNEAETAMLQQFMVLLNEKKRKIRDQSRILAGAKVDKVAAAEVQSAREEVPKSRKAGPSRSSKRKAPAKVPVEEQESDVEPMDVSEAKQEEQDAEEDSGPGIATPDRTEDEDTEDEAEDVSQHPTASRVPSSQKSAGAARVVVPPPTRELPFSRRPTRSQQSRKSSPPPAGEESEPDDDEL